MPVSTSRYLSTFHRPPSTHACGSGNVCMSGIFIPLPPSTSAKLASSSSSSFTPFYRGASIVPRLPCRDDHCVHRCRLVDPASTPI